MQKSAGLRHFCAAFGAKLRAEVGNCALQHGEEQGLDHGVRELLGVGDQARTAELVELDFVEFHRQAILEAEVDPVEERLFWLGDLVGGVAALLLEETPEEIAVKLAVEDVDAGLLIFLSLEAVRAETGVKL